MEGNKPNRGLDDLIEASLKASAASAAQSQSTHNDDDIRDSNAKKKSLSSKLALEIFAERCLKTGYATVESTFIAKKYGVSSKTVRDIWNRRTWAEATKPLWTDEEKESTEELDACKERKRQANKKRKLAHMRQGNDKSGDSHDSDGHEMAEEMHQPDKDEGSVQETCSGSETSTMCEQSSAKESQAEDSSDACNPKGSSSGSPEGSSSPTSSMQSKSTTSSDTGRSEQCGAHKDGVRKSMPELLGEGKEPKGTERTGGRGGLMDNGYRSEGSSECSAGSKRRGESQHGERRRTGKESGKHARLKEAQCSLACNPHSGAEQLQTGRDKEGSETSESSLETSSDRSNSSKQVFQIEPVKSGASGEIAALLKKFTEQQQLILEQQQQILNRATQLVNQFPIAVEQRASHAEPMPQPGPWMGEARGMLRQGMSGAAFGNLGQMMAGTDGGQGLGIRAGEQGSFQGQGQGMGGGLRDYMQLGQQGHQAGSGQADEFQQRLLLQLLQTQLSSLLPGMNQQHRV
ncbi:hypothetical protein GUITHDRAFT_165776 [Guillardia theta CCMP2712]|uniref:Uncharacterized protein n=3 Tax=Guillardia theta TaxID=55529 RepID=L1IJU0_GUITC|nr:hypothetical protein GUITHDRAFT_165776 [Guillardia theta CCMP2712]EKX36362.1 hypothetical protein GUITHDRAFT_165776 [Guillardia theta CCMP2712]|eukprot:XP_005823342.1 hypothetical protein GUITHDRAFT_165776 [Guillardia theta CCMP2712]